LSEHATLNYAGGEATSLELPAGLRPTPLLIPNVIALIVLVLPIHNDDTPLSPILDWVARLGSGGGPSLLLMDALLTGPFLLAIPLAAWTVRLCLTRLRPPAAAETWTALSVTLTALTMLVICLGYCVFGQPRQFGGAAAGGAAILAVGAGGLWTTRHLRRQYPLALLAMTTAWAANATLTTLVVVAHAAWRFGTVVAMVVVAAQIAGGIACVRRWRPAVVNK
jgi:hypothetical protein